MNEINYEKIVWDYNDAALKDCVHQLYPLFECQYLKENAFRKSDLTENLIRLEKKYRYDEPVIKLPNYKPQSNLQLFLSQMDFFAENYFSHRHWIANYYRRAKESIHKLNGPDGGMNDLEDLIKIFLSFMRCQYGMWKNPKAGYSPFEFAVKAEDAEMLKEFRTHPFPEVGPNNPNKLLGFAKNSRLLNKPQKFNDYAYFNIVVIYCRLMQFEGLYEKEEG